MKPNTIGVRLGVRRKRVVRVIVAAVVIVVMAGLIRRSLPLHPSSPPRTSSLQHTSLLHPSSLLQLLSSLPRGQKRGELRTQEDISKHSNIQRGNKMHRLLGLQSAAYLQASDMNGRVIANQRSSIQKETYVNNPTKYYGQARKLNNNETETTETTTQSTSTIPSTTHNGNLTPFYIDENYLYDTAEEEPEYDYEDYGDLLKQISFSRIIFFCEYIYSAIYGSYENITDTVLPYGNTSLIVITEEKFVSACIPFYEVLDPDACEKKNLMTICLEEEVAFLDVNHGCPRPSDEDVYFEKILAIALLEGDKMCLEALCRGEVRVVERWMKAVEVRVITPNVTTDSGAQCHNHVEEYYHGNNTDIIYYTKNLYWPICFLEYDVVWLSDPAVDNLDIDWSFLPYHCRAGEWFLISMVIVIVVGGLVGNLAAILIMWKAKDHIFDPLVIANISQALVDLLLTTLVLAPGLFFTFYIRKSKHETEEPYSSSAVGVEVIKSGFVLFSGVMMNTFCVVSVMNLYFLSLVRYCTATDKTKFPSFIRSRMTGFVIVTWIMGLLTALGLMHYSDGTTTFWHSFYKLPLSLAPDEPRVVLILVMTVLGAMYLTALILSLLAVCKFVKKQPQQIEETEEMISANQEVKEFKLSHYILPIFFLLVSMITGGIACFVYISQPKWEYRELLCYLCWWLYLSSVCWNPWLYNLPRHRFRQVLTSMAQALMPKGSIPRPSLRKFRKRWRKASGIQAAEDSEETAPLKPKSAFRIRRRRTPPGLRRNMYTGRVV